MLSGGKAGLVSVDVLRKEQEQNRRRERHNRPLEGWPNFFSSFKQLLMMEHRKHTFKLWLNNSLTNLNTMIRNPNLGLNIIPTVYFPAATR